MYFSSNKQGWYKLDQVNLSTENLSVYDTWIDVARIDNDAIDLEFLLLRSAYDEEGELIPIETEKGTTATISFRLIQPNSVAGKVFIRDLSVVGTPSELGPYEVNWEPPLKLPVGSKLQVKLNSNSDSNTFKTAQLYFFFAYLFTGTNPKITYLLES